MSGCINMDNSYICNGEVVMKYRMCDRCGKCAVDGKFDKQGEGYVRLIGNTGDYRVIK